jgi:hypothetical protein
LRTVARIEIAVLLVVDVVGDVGGGAGAAGVSIWPARTETASVTVMIDATHVCRKVFTLSYLLQIAGEI